MLRILHDTKIDFIRLWKIALGLSVALIVPGLIWAAIGGFSYSMEFTGGTLVHIKFNEATDIALVRSSLVNSGLATAEPVSFGTDNEYIIRARDVAADTVGSAGAERVAASIVRALEQQFGDAAFSTELIEAVGPKVGGELRQQAALALLVSFALTLLYLSWRFEWRFAVASILATLHDIIATVAFIRYTNIEISVFVVGAILTVIGYSLNDTVVVFDRVRENLTVHRKKPLYDLLNLSVNETLPRTVMTSTTTLATLLALIFLGGEFVRPFALIMTLGIVIGTFSSIFVASPLLLIIERRWPRAVGDKGGVGAPISRDALRGGPARPRPQN
jgi:preprotein translocase subunit SecF